MITRMHKVLDLRQKARSQRGDAQPPSEAWTQQSIAELREQLVARKLTPTQLLEAHIQRIETVNPAINALVTDRFAQARSEAEAATTTLAQSENPSALPPLFGIPCSIKEFIAVAGMPQTGGVLHRRGQVAAEDGTVTTRLRQAGAVILGVTNVPEGGLWLESYNLIYGRTSNPWDVTRTSGGSSGGEGALVAAGGSVFGIGSDVGGSIRIPAAFCGTVGHKPSAGLIPNTGHYPPATPENGYLVSGPLCRRVGDVLPILRALAGPDGLDALVPGTPAHNLAAVPSLIKDPRLVRIPQLQVHAQPLCGGVKIHAVMQEAVRSAAQALAQSGAQLSPEPPPRLQNVFSMWTAAMTAANPEGYEGLLSGGGRLPVLRELLRYPLGRSRFVLPSLITVLSEAVLRRLPLKMQRFVDQAARLKDELDELLGEHGVLLHPPYSRPAPKHNTPLWTPFDFACTALWNILGYPVTVVPLGLSDEGLPVSVQIIARQGNDHLTLAAAQILEQHFGGWVRAEPPPPSQPSRYAAYRPTAAL